MTDPSRSTRHRVRGPLILASVLVVLCTGAWSAIRPRNDRAWVPEQSRVPTATIAGNIVTIRAVRDFDWITAGDPVQRWDDRTYDLDRIESVWFVLTPFAEDWRGPAHAFLSFGFSDSQYVAISVEARKEVGETYSLWKGMLKRFELMYVVADERDLIGLRALRQGDDVYVYPIRATQEAVRELFVAMVRTASGLADRPEFYGTLRNNCTTRILRHVNAVVPRHIRYDWRVLLPGYSDELAWDRGLIDTTLPLDSARMFFRVNDRVRATIDAPDFPIRIRD
jgi:Domain of unknown function (DUF4105)